MSSSFRNFFISFILCLLVFGYIGYNYLWPEISAAVDFTGTPSADTSGDSRPNETSNGTVSGGDDVSSPVHKDGAEVTYLFMGEAADGNIAAFILVRVDEGAETFTYCSVPASASLTNEVGVSVPISVYFADLDTNSVLARASAMMGFPIDYYMRVDVGFLNTLIATVRNPHFELTRAVNCINPKYDGMEFDTSDSSSDTSEDRIPEDYYLSYSAGNVNLTEESLNALTNFSVSLGNTADLVITTDIYNALFVQYLTGSATKRNTSVARSLAAKAKQTNLTDDAIDRYSGIFFTYDEYKMTKVNYSSWNATVDAFRNAD